MLFSSLYHGNFCKVKKTLIKKNKFPRCDLLMSYKKGIFARFILMFVQKRSFLDFR